MWRLALCTGRPIYRVNIRLKKNELYWDKDNMKFVITNKNTTPDRAYVLSAFDCYPGSWR